jgi:RNA polymerase sigma factor (sigma-70 family)
MSQPSLQKRPASWPGDNDREVVRQMLEDPLSPHWQDCRDFIMRLVRKLNVPVDHQDDVVQEMMITVTRNLPNFKHNCKLTTWLGKSVRWRVSDLRRKIVSGKKLFEPLRMASEESEGEDESEQFPALRTVESECIDRENVRELVKKLEDFAHTHRDSRRWLQVIKKIFLDGQSVEEVAEELGMKASNVYYIRRAVYNELQDQ